MTADSKHPHDHEHPFLAEMHRLTEAERAALKAVLHRSGRARNVNELAAERLTPGQRIADAVAAGMGSWRFILVQSCLLVFWVSLNVVGWIRHWDPYPFILLNLALSFQAAYSAPIIMMSQNRQATKDRLQAEEDYRINVRAELEVAAIHARLDELAGAQWQMLLALQREQLDLLTRLEGLTAEVHGVVTRIPIPDGAAE